DPAGLDRLEPALELLQELRVDGEAPRHLEQLAVEPPEAFGRDRGDDLSARRVRDVTFTHGARSRLREGGAEPLVGRLQLRLDVAHEPVGLLLRHDAFGDEPGCELLADARMCR